MIDFKNKKTIIILASIISIIIVMILCIVFIKQKQNDNLFYIDSSETESNQNTEIKDEDAEERKIIFVHVIGEVEKPGLIDLSEGSRIFDAVEKTGGFTTNADITKINLAYVLEDGQKIVIPSVEETKVEESFNDYIESDAGEGVIEEATTSSGKIDINSASQTEIETLPGIGPSLASKIIAYRNLNGKYKSVEDLKNVSGIGGSKYDNIKEWVIAK